MFKSRNIALSTLVVFAQLSMAQINPNLKKSNHLEFGSIIPSQNQIQHKAGIVVKINNTAFDIHNLKQLSLVTTHIPVPNVESTLNIQLEIYDFCESDFAIHTTQSTSPLDITKGIHYQGHIIGQPKSIVTLSVFDQSIYGSIYTEQGKQYSILPESDTYQETIVRISEESNNHSPVQYGACKTDDVRHYLQPQVESASRSGNTCKRVALSIHADYALFLKMNASTIKTSEYILGLFNNVIAIYRKDKIQLSLGEIVIHTMDDKMPNTTAEENLSKFANTYKTYKGDACILLGGFSKNGNPSLGGVAWINSLCFKSYAYAFCNVAGNFSAYPTFSWDVYCAAHELGHILGSRHTHACVWGPTKNKPLDNCWIPEGGCSSGPVVSKGTIMSYCHLAGKAGIDFTLGFGMEPGEVIRTKIKNASCLLLHKPSQIINSIANSELFANNECLDGSLTHYYFDNNSIEPSDDIYIMSIQKNGQTIGEIGDGNFQVSTHNASFPQSTKYIPSPYLKSTDSLFVSNQYWNISSDKSITNPINIKIKQQVQSIQAFNPILPKFDSSNLNWFSVEKPGKINPDSLHKNTVDSLFNIHSWTWTKDTSSFAYYDISTSQLQAGYSNGVFKARQSAFELGSFTGSYIGNKKGSLTWSTRNEFDIIKYEVQKSTNNKTFYTIYTTNPKKAASNIYQMTDAGVTLVRYYYKLKITTANGTVSYSPTVVITRTSALTIQQSSNDAASSMVLLEPREEDAICNIAIYDVYGNCKYQEQSVLLAGNTHLPIYNLKLLNGSYKVVCTIGQEILTSKFLILK